jgi:hypothetical protein
MDIAKLQRLVVLAARRLWARSVALHQVQDLEQQLQDPGIWVPVLQKWKSVDDERLNRPRTAD